MALETRERLLLCKSKEQNLRAQLKNQFATRQLQETIYTLNNKWDRREYVMNRNIRQLEEAMWRSEMLARNSAWEEETGTPKVKKSEKDNVNVLQKRMRIKSAPNFGQDICGNDRTCGSVTTATGTIRWRKKSAKKDAVSCKFGANHKCVCFPCRLPRSYTNIGFDIRQNNASNEFIESTYISKENRERLLIDLESQSVRRPLRTSRDQTVQKERSLKKIISEMKVRSEESQPKDWCINYGKPTSVRKIYRVARPSSSADFVGI